MERRTLAQLARALRGREVSSRELTTETLRRIEAHDGALNSFISVVSESALAAADRADRALARGEGGPLTGIPFAHKDIFCTAGIRTTCGSRMLANFVSPYDATVVERLAAAGVVMVGKTNMDEFAMGSSNETSWFGPVHNPWDLTRSPGGSSGGSAAAVAAGLVPAATGTDTGGSIRQPAALTGITGFKPTYGRVSRYGMVAFASSLDQAGVLTLSAEDAACLIGAMAGFDPRDSTCADVAVPAYGETLGQSLKGRRIGVPKEFFDAGLDGPSAAGIREALRVFEGLGASLVELSLPSLALSVPTYYIVAPAECSSNLSRFDGVRFGYRHEGARTLEELYKLTRREGFGAEVKRRIMTGTYVLSAGYFDAYYLKAQKARRLIADEFQRCFATVDIIAGPTSPTPAFRLGEKVDDPVQMYLNDIYTIPVNLAGLPGISVPCGFAAGLPIGLQLIGPHFGEAPVLNFAHRYQQETDWHQRVPALEGIGRDQAAAGPGATAMNWEVFIGLEIHAQLATKSKIFSGASTAYGAAPNTQACLVDLGYPGVLPVLNAEAVRMAVRFGLAIGATVARRSIFARKNYFYPDLPKGYQISQYELPIVHDGEVTIDIEAGGTRTVRIIRAHLEEDAGKSLHETFAGATGIDLNRAGTPLVEIVSAPDLRSAKEAVAYMKKIHQLVTYLGICDGNMQEGSFRCDANVSLRPAGATALGTRTETKNLNSFRFLEKAILFEIGRQTEVLESGGTIVQETRLYDSDRDETRAMRSKEEANDYRYFPDPDLLPVELDEAYIGSLQATLPELPDAKRVRFVAQYGLSVADAAMLAASRELGDYYESVVRDLGASGGGEGKLAANWVNGELMAALNRDSLDIRASRVSPAQLAGLLRRVVDNTISGKIAKQVFEELWSAGSGAADAIIDRSGLRQITDAGALEGIVDQVLAANPEQVQQYRAGKTKVIGFLVGQIMQASAGKANPGQVNELLKKKLG